MAGDFSCGFCPCIVLYPHPHNSWRSTCGQYRHRVIHFKQGSSMRTFILGMGASLLLIAVPAVATSQDPGTEEQKTLYALGLAISQSLATFSLSEAELDMVKTGMVDGVLKRTPKVDLQAYGRSEEHTSELQSQF